MKTLREIGAGLLSWHPRKNGYEITSDKEVVAEVTWEKIVWQWNEFGNPHHPVIVGIVSGDGRWTFKCNRDLSWRSLSRGQVALTATEAESGREVGRFMGETHFLSSSRFIEVADGRKFPWIAPWKLWRRVFAFGLDPHWICGPDGNSLISFEPDYGHNGKIRIMPDAMNLAELPLLLWFGFYISRHETNYGR